jgi:hypothetical protein
MPDICSICRTHPVNPMISKNHCSRICWILSLREDLKYLSEDSIKRIALNRLNQIKEETKSN